MTLPEMCTSFVHHHAGRDGRARITIVVRIRKGRGACQRDESRPSRLDLAVSSRTAVQKRRWGCGCSPTSYCEAAARTTAERRGGGQEDAA